MINFLKRGVETLRQPDRNPRCYEFTDDERLLRIKEWNDRNENKSDLAEQNQESVYYGA